RKHDRAMKSTSCWIESCIGLPTECPDEWVTIRYQFGGRQILLTRPQEPDRLLEDPLVQQASRAHDYMPYWAYLWPVAILLAGRILAQEWPAEMRALEIGCGLGLAGLAALSAGLCVTFS